MFPLQTCKRMLDTAFMADKCRPQSLLTNEADNICSYMAVSEGKSSIRIGRVAMVGISLLVLAYALINPPSVFWIMFLGGSMAACSWMPVALGSIFPKGLPKRARFAGCFLVC